MSVILCWPCDELETHPCLSPQLPPYHDAAREVWREEGGVEGSVSSTSLADVPSSVWALLRKALRHT